jgi:hypothetical protein
MFVFTLVDNNELEHAIPFYYRSKRLGFNERLNFIFNDKEVHRTFKMLRLKSNIHLHESLEHSFLAGFLTKPQQFLYIDVKTVLTKDPSVLFQDALTRSEIVYYEYKNNYKLFGANYNSNFKFYYPDLLDDYELYLQKNEGNIYTLPSCGLTTTETIKS